MGLMITSLNMKPILAVAVLISLYIVYFINRGNFVVPRETGTDIGAVHVSKLSHILRDVSQPFILPVTADEFVSSDHRTHHLPKAKPWSSSLGSRLCFLDVERDEKTTGKSERSWGALNHWMYARIHGYSYEFRNAPLDSQSSSASERTFLRIKQLLNQRCHVVVLMELSLGFSELRLPVEWLFNRWGIPTNTSLVFHEYPVHPSKGFPGMVIVQDTGRRRELEKAWKRITKSGHRPDGASTTGPFISGHWTQHDVEQSLASTGIVQSLVEGLFKEQSRSREDPSREEIFKLPPANVDLEQRLRGTFDDVGSSIVKDMVSGLGKEFDELRDTTLQQKLTSLSEQPTAGNLDIPSMLDYHSAQVPLAGL